MLPCKRPGCDTWSVLLKRMFPGFIWRPIHRDAIDWSPDVCIENPTSYRRLRTFHRSLLKFVKVQQWIPGQENNSDLTFADVPSVCFVFTCCHWISLAQILKNDTCIAKIWPSHSSSSCVLKSLRTPRFDSFHRSFVLDFFPRILKWFQGSVQPAEEEKMRKE